MEIDINKFHLKSFSIFEYLDSKDSAFIKNKMIRKEFEKQDVILKENSFPKGVYIVKKGKIKIFQTNSDGKQSIVYIYKKGDFFGYRPILANELSPVTASAMEDSVVYFIPKEPFLQVLEKSNKLAKKLLINLSEEFTVWINKVTIFSQYSVKNRVALSLLILNQIYKRSDDETKTVFISINRDDLAGFVGTAKETLVRSLRILKDQGIITTRGTKIIVHKPLKLKQIINEV
jgi:CRP-like cAMP-binding protein